MTLAELLVIIAIIGVVLAVAVPSFSTLLRDMSTNKAKSDVFAALTAARGRAIATRSLVALHVFRDSPLYGVASTSPVRARWGYTWHADTSEWIPVPHIPTGKMVMRLEVPNPKHSAGGSGGVGFIWPVDHEPVVLPETLGVCRPDTVLFNAQDVSLAAKDGWYVDISSDFGAPPDTAAYRLAYYEDFYIVFTEDGKLATVLVDYNVNPDTGPQTVVRSVNTANVGQTWSAPGLCLFDVNRFRSLSDDYDTQMTDRDQYAYINGLDCHIALSAYTGMPLEGVMR